jgi:hypothetical protein
MNRPLFVKVLPPSLAALLPFPLSKKCWKFAEPVL